MKPKKSTLNRRQFLKGTGGVTLSLPFLPSLLPRQAWGQSAPTIKRYFAVINRYDYGHHQHWFPTLNQLPNQVTPGNGDQSFRYASLNQLRGQRRDLSLVFGEQFNPYLNRMNLFRGLDLPTRIAHGSGQMLGNIRETDGHCAVSRQLSALPTIDQVLAANSNFNPGRRPVVYYGENVSTARASDGSVNRVGFNYDDPFLFYNRLFNPNGVPVPENGSTSVVSHPRRSLLNAVIEDYRRVVNGRNISSVDRQILTDVADRFADIERRLVTSTATQGCSYSGIDASWTRNDGVWGSDINYDQHANYFDLYARIYAAAAACDLGRSFVFAGQTQEYHDRHPTLGFHDGHSHQPFTTLVSNGNRINHQYMAEIVRRYYEVFTIPLLRYLDATTEANGRSILDNSLVHLVGESSVLHCDSSRPCAFIGGAGGDLTTGHMVDYSQRQLGPADMQGDNFNRDTASERFGHAYPGIHYNRSLTTVLQAMGLRASDYENANINRFFQGRTDSALGSQNNGITRIGGYGHVGPDRPSGNWDGRPSQEFFSSTYATQNLHFYKDPLPMPSGSAS